MVNNAVALVQICVTLLWWFSHRTAAFSTEQCTSPLLFLQAWSLTRWFKPLTEYLWLPLWCHSFLTCVHMRTNQQRIIIIMQDCWIRNTVGVQGVLEKRLVRSMILQPILHASTEVICDSLAALCDGWQTAAKRSDLNRKKHYKCNTI